MLKKKKELPGGRVEWKQCVSDGLMLCQITLGARSRGAIFHRQNQIPLHTCNQPGSYLEATGPGVMRVGKRRQVCFGELLPRAAPLQHREAVSRTQRNKPLSLSLAIKDFWEGSHDGAWQVP